MSSSNIIITPISPAQQEQVIELTTQYIERAGRLFNRSFDLIPVLFDLRGRSAGMYRVKNGCRTIRYNPWIFAKYFDSNLTDTVPHEVAHYITEQLYGVRSVRPHGEQWKSVMRAFDVQPVRTSNYNMDGIPVRQYQRFHYYCECTTHQLASRRHKQIKQGLAYYACRQCGAKLMPGAMPGNMPGKNAMDRRVHYNCSI